MGPNPVAAKSNDARFNDSLADPIRFAGRLSLEEFRVARRLLKSKLDRFAEIVFAVLCVFPCLYMAWFTGVLSNDGNETELLRFVLAGLFLTSLLCGGFIVGVVRRRTVPKRLQLRGDPPFEEITGDVAETGISVHSPRYDFCLRWSAMTGFRSNQDVALILYTPGRGVLIIPRSHLTSVADWSRLLGVLSQRIPRR
jgi:hypothetical protein